MGWLRGIRGPLFGGDFVPMMAWKALCSSGPIWGPISGLIWGISGPIFGVIFGVIFGISGPIFGVASGHSGSSFWG